MPCLLCLSHSVLIAVISNQSRFVTFYINKFITFILLYISVVFFNFQRCKGTTEIRELVLEFKIEIPDSNFDRPENKFLHVGFCICVVGWHSVGPSRMQCKHDTGTNQLRSFSCKRLWNFMVAELG